MENPLEETFYSNPEVLENEQPVSTIFFEEEREAIQAYHFFNRQADADCRHLDEKQFYHRLLSAKGRNSFLWSKSPNDCFGNLRPGGGGISQLVPEDKQVLWKTWDQRSGIDRLAKAIYDL
jgi:hypothetical protein